MEQPRKGPLSHIAAGLIIAAALIVLRVIYFLTKTDETGALQWVPYLVICAGLIYFVNQYAKARYYELTFGPLFSYGFKTTAVLTLVVILFTVIFLNVFPEIREQAFIQARTKMAENKDLTSEDIEKGISLAKRLFWVFAIGGIILLYAIVGAIGSAIAAGLAPKKPIRNSDQLSF